MEVRPGYKQTDVGVIPEDWEAAALGVIAGLDVGYAFSSAWFQKHDGVPLLRGENVGYGRPNWLDTRRLAETHAGAFGEYRLRPGDVVIGMDRTFTKSGTKISIVRDGDCPCLLVQRVGRFIPKKCDGRFLWAVLSSARFRQSLLAEQKGMDIPHLSRAEILRPLVAFPTRATEREAIAEALSDADALIESLEQLLAKNRQIKQGAMQNLLTGKKRLPGFGGPWAIKTLGEVADTDPENLGGDTLPSFAFNYIALEDVDVGRLNGFSERVFKTAPSRARRRLRKEDVLVSTVRPNLMSHLLFTMEGDRWVCSTGFCVVRCRKGVSHPGYVYFQMFARTVTRQIEALLTGSNYPAINGSDVRALQIPFPEYDEQSAIATVLSDMDAEIVELEAKLAKASEIKQGMMQELLTGRIRLV